MGEFGYDPYDPLRYQERKARQEFSDAELAEMRRLLDDPSISAQNKQNMLYALSNANKVSDEEIDKYAREVGADAEDVRRGGESLDENLEHARQSLTEAPQEQWQAGARENQRKVQSAQQALGAGGFSSSDEIIDQAEVALKLFDDFHPRYQKASGLGLAGAAPTTPSEPQVATAQLSTSDTGAPAGATAAYTHSGGDPQSIRNGLDEFRGIAFTAFRTDAEMLNTAHATVSESTEALNSAWSSGTADWTGDAKSAAEQTNNGLVKGAGDLSQALRTAPGNITATVDAIEQNVTKFAEAVLQVYGDGTVAGLTPQQVDAFIKAKEQLPGAIQELEAKIQELENQSWWDRLTNFDDMFLHPLTVAMTIVSPIGSLVGYEFAKVITVDNIREETEKMKGALQEAEQKLAEFIADYDNKANTVHQQGSTYVSGIQENYTALIDALNQSLDPDPFAAGDKGGDTKPSDVGAGPAPAPGGTGGVPGGGTGGAPGGGTGGVPGAGGGTGGAPGAGGMPEMKPPELEGEAGTGTNPVTGKPLEVDPETGKPYPIDPETGEPVKDAGGDRDTLTVEKGEHTLELEEPDDQGKMAISVDDGSGEAKDYKLDFGTGVEDLRGDEGFGPQGSEPGGEPGTGAEPGAGDEQVYRPGPDGKIHIEDGNLKITAEQPDGPDGPTKVTVDDGNPPPTTYTLGEARSETPAAGAGGGPVRDGIRPMPAQGENPFADGGASGGGTGGAAVSGAGSVSGSVDLDGGEGPGQPDGAAAGSSAPAGSVSGSVGFGGGDGLVEPGAAGGGSPEAEGAVAGGSDAEAHAEQTTSPQAVGSTSGGGGEFDAAQSLFGGSGPGEALSGGIQAGADPHAVPAGAGLGAAPGGMGDSTPAQGGGAGMAAGAGGMGMMGGMGAMGGAGGGQGDDQERSNPFRIDGSLFETSASANRISGSLGDDTETSVRFDR